MLCDEGLITVSRDLEMDMRRAIAVGYGAVALEAVLTVYGGEEGSAMIIVISTFGSGEPEFDLRISNGFAGYGGEDPAFQDITGYGFRLLTERARWVCKRDPSCR